jgi:hypothetical protein
MRTLIQNIDILLYQIDTEQGGKLILPDIPQRGRRKTSFIEQGRRTRGGKHCSGFAIIPFADVRRNSQYEQGDESEEDEPDHGPHLDLRLRVFRKRSRSLVRLFSEQFFKEGGASQTNERVEIEVERPVMATIKDLSIIDTVGIEGCGR